MGDELRRFESQKIRPTLGEIHVHKVAVEQADAFKIVVHEAIHGHGPHVEYRGVGAAVEELTTELVAKRVTRDACGLTAAEGSSWYSRGYVALVAGAVGRVANIPGVIPASDELRTELENAAIRFKVMGGRLSAQEAVEAYASHVDVDKIAPRTSEKRRQEIRRELALTLQHLSVAADQSTLAASSRART